MSKKKINSEIKETASARNKAPAAKASDKKPMSRRFRHSLLSAVLSLLVIVGVILVNLIAATLTDKFASFTADITTLKSFELNEKSKDIARNLQEDVTISFMSDRSTYLSLDPYCKQTAFMAEAMAKLSGGKIKVDYVDLVRNPSYASEQNSDEELTTTDIVVSCGSLRRVLHVSDLFRFESYSDDYRYIAGSSAEQVMDNCILAITNSTQLRAAIISDNTDADYSYFVKTLKNDNYTVTEVALKTEEIPDNTDMVVIFSPAGDFSEECITKLQSFLENGGRYQKTLFLAANPTDISTPKLDTFLTHYSLEIGHSYAFEADETRLQTSGACTGVLTHLFPDEHTAFISESANPVISNFRTRPVYIIGLGDNALPLLSYSTSLSGEQPFDYDENWNVEDSITGNIFVLAEGTYGTEEARSTVIAAGSYTLFDKEYLSSSYSNKTYLSSMLSYYNHRDIPRVDMTEKVISQYDLTIDKQTAVNLGFLVYALIPIIILGIGFTVYLMRKNR